MAYRLRDAHAKLELHADVFRDPVEYSDDIQNATKKLLEASGDKAREEVIAEWLTEKQPCIFGKLAAARALNTYCFLTEADLNRSDEVIQEKIQAARTEWKSLGEHGSKSAFIILATSPVLVRAAPDESLKQFACLLASLYLKKPISPDRIYTDTIRLWNLRFTERRRWGVGVNVFAIQGDQRWWNDHRIPGGLGFSMNSVGHLVASEARRNALIEAKPTTTVSGGAAKRIDELNKLETEIAKLSKTAIQSLDHALKFAMRTINGASHSDTGKCPWSRATSLLREVADSPCPIKLIAADPVLKGMNWTTYIGWYHTDITIPSEYFTASQQRPATIITPISLDFSYLHARREPDYKTLAIGQVVRPSSRSRKAE